jgi:RHS repeat-associated protein
MSKPSGTSAEIVNLPSGGGSVSGSGASFNVDLNTGNATAGLDLLIPTGPNGLKPSLTLFYSTSSGDGAFGLGWSVGWATISRKITPASDPQNPAGVGAYVLQGVGDLVDVGGGRFRPIVDTGGQLIEFANGAWTLTDCTDTSYTLGTTPNAQLGGSPAGAWLLDSTTDSSGNVIAYTWLEDGAARYPGSISWGTYKVLFQYESRPDLVINGQFGAPIVFGKRCSSIELHVTTEAQSLVRSWSLAYNDSGGRGRSLLATISEQGHSADGAVLTAPDRNYSYTALGKPCFVPVTGWTTTLVDADTDFVDLNGDGLPDILRLGAGMPSMHPNLGAGNFGFPRACSLAPATLQLSSPNVAFADMSGEGNVDLLVINQNLSGYYPLSVPQGGSGPSQFGMPVTFETAPPYLPADPRVRLLDLNGDGVTDLMMDTGRSWMLYLREDAATWSETPWILSPDRTPPVELSDPHVYVADMTGDGLSDIVRIDGRGVFYWPGRADGGWGAAVRMAPSPVFTRFYDPTRMSVVDIDGDGCADLVYVASQSVTVWRNVGAGQLADPMVVQFTPPAQPGSFRILDLLGTGNVGVLFELPPLVAAQPRQSFLDLSGGSKPYLMSSYAEGPGQTTQITYRTSTGFAQEDAADGAPWQTYHPYPVYCVARTDQTDNATGLTSTTEYAYHDGRYDPVTRTFVGFGRVDCEQDGDASCPTLRTETTFHVGLDPTDPGRVLFGDEALKLGALRRRILQTAAFGLDGSDLEANPYSVTIHTYDALLIPSGLNDGNVVVVPYTTGTTEERWERSQTQISTRVIEYLAVNDEGDVTLQRTVAQRTGVPTADQDITTAITFATGGKNIRLPARVTQTSPDGTVIACSLTLYDGDPFSGLPEGQATQGLVTRVEALAFADSFVSGIWGATPPDLTLYGYHRQPGDATGWWITRRSHQRTTTPTGPLLLTKGPLGGTNRLQLDAAGQRVVAVTDELGNTVTSTTDPRVWQTASVTDANGHMSTDIFDVLGRLSATIGPLDSEALPLVAYEYTVGPVSSVSSATRVVHGDAETLPTVTWIGGPGQVLGKAQPSSTPGQWIVSSAALRNVRGLNAATYLPYAVGGTAWQPPPAGAPATAFVFDALGRVVQCTRPDGLVIVSRREMDTLTVSETWPGGTPTDIERQVLDAAGQMIAVSRNAGDHWVEQQYGFDPSGKMASVTLPGGGSVTISHDLLGRRFAYQSPDAGRSVQLIDAGGNTRLFTNAAGQQVRNEFDAGNRITAVFYDAEASPRAKYEYLDQGDPVPADGITTNRYGRLWRITDEVGTVVRQYDECGRTLSSQRTVAATSGVFGNQAAYDALGRPTSITLPPTVAGSAGRTVGYAYGPDGNLVSASGIVTQATYDILGRATSIAYANGATSAITYRPNGGSIGRVTVTDSAGTVLRDTTVTLSEAFVRGLSSAVPDDDSVIFSYDGLRRLTGAAYSQGPTAADAHTWSFDDTFALTASSDSGSLSYRPGTHQLASVGGQAVTYDVAGRMAQGRCGAMQFDSASRLAGVTIPGGTKISHTYDYGGRRSVSVTGGAQTYFSPIDGLEVQADNTVCWIAFGRLKLAAEVNGALWFIHGNALGGMDLITDAAGHYACRVRQTPFGLGRPAPGAPPTGIPATLSFLLVGADASGLICQGRRWYDPQVAQFISPDPVVTSAYFVGSWNPYIYCLGNPIALCDPSGLSFLSVLEFIEIAIVAAVCAVAAIYTGGASLVALGVITQNLGSYALVGVAIGSLGGAVAGEMAAQKAGGNILLGALVGAFVGGLGSLAGGALVPVGTSATAVSFGTYVLNGISQGLIAGAGTGLAVGFAGGKGDAESMLKGMFQGAVWGAVIGGLIGAGVGGIVGGDDPDKFLSIGDLKSKLADFSTVLKGANSTDNLVQIPLQQVPQFAQTGLTASNIFGFASNFITTGPTASGWINIPLGWMSSAVLDDGLVASLTSVSIATDQLGFGYAEQIAVLSGLAPLFIDFAATEWQMEDPNGFDKAQTDFNQAFGSTDT